MRLIIKNMVCPRCVTPVEQLLEKDSFQAKYVRLSHKLDLDSAGKKAVVAFLRTLTDTSGINN